MSDISSKQNTGNGIGKEIFALTSDKLTTYDEATGHYSLNPLRSAFIRCENCFNLSEADCFADKDGNWVWCNECLFCIQRAFDMLGYYEHGIIPKLTLHNTPKKRELSDKNDLYSLLEKVAKQQETNADRPQDSSISAD